MYITKYASWVENSTRNLSLPTNCISFIYASASEGKGCVLKFCIHNAYFNKWPIKKNYQNNLLKICLCCHFLCQPKKFLWNYFISQCIAFQWGLFFRTKQSNRSITRLFNQKKFLLNQQEFKKLQNQFATRGPILGEWFVLTQIKNLFWLSALKFI